MGLNGKLTDLLALLGSVVTSATAVIAKLTELDTFLGS